MTIVLAFWSASGEKQESVGDLNGKISALEQRLNLKGEESAVPVDGQILASFLRSCSRE